MLKKQWKKAMSLLLVLTMAVCMVPGAMAAGGAPNQDSDGYYIIEDDADLTWFTNEVNNGNTGISAKLAADVNLTAGIATDSANPYSGTFDGQGHSITVGTEVFQYVGDATIKNVTLVKSGSMSLGQGKGVLAGTVSGTATFERCVNKVSVSSGSYYVGGLIGTTTGTVTMTECGNEGNITASGYGNLAASGGIVGFVSSGKITFICCYNSGAVTSTDGRNTGAGGIVGRNQFNAPVYMYDCYNTGTISAPTSNTGTSTGALIGYCATNGTANAYYCYNAGDVIKKNTATNVMYGTKLTMLKCYTREDALVNVGVGTSTTSLIQMPADDMQDESFVETINSVSKYHSYVADTLGINGGYPIFAWQLPEEDSVETLEPVITISKAGETDVAVVTAPEDGWTVGSNTFVVTGENACVVAVTSDGETYTRVPAVSNGDGSYSFTADLDEDTEIVVALKGDVTLDGTVDNMDALLVTAVFLQKATLEPIESNIGDVNNDNVLDNMDALLLTAVSLGKTDLSWT